jgi:hypothetical protein
MKLNQMTNVTTSSQQGSLEYKTRQTKSIYLFRKPIDHQDVILTWQQKIQNKLLGEIFDLKMSADITKVDRPKKRKKCKCQKRKKI